MPKINKLTLSALAFSLRFHLYGNKIMRTFAPQFEQ